tara:strand:+ start:61 stop:294 length:234 start_codon:yes stop_codon:yes gene_type:complete
MYNALRNYNEERMAKGDLMLSIVSGETTCDAGLLMEDEAFVSEAKRLFKEGSELDSLSYDTVVGISNQLIDWVNTNY